MCCVSYQQHAHLREAFHKNKQHLAHLQTEDDLSVQLTSQKIAFS